MATSTYTDLKSQISDFMARNDIAGSAADFIALAEKRLNRKIGPVNSDATLTGVVGSRVIPVSSLSMVRPIALHISDIGGEREIGIVADGSLSYSDDNGEPSFAAFDNGSVNFDCPLDQPYSFRLTYQAKLALSDVAPTNWLLTDHFDVYLAASIVWGCLYVKDVQGGAVWKGVLEEALPEVRSIKAKERGNLMTVDPALTARGRYSYTDGNF